MRLFIAIQIPSDIKQSIYYVSSSLLKDKVKIISPGNIHFTLQFLGEVDKNKMENIKNALSEVEFQPFNLEIKDIGFFPNKDCMKIVWLGVENPVKIISLTNKINQILLPLGFKPDKKFVPHLTIARVKQKIDSEKLIENFKFKSFGSFSVSKFYLMQSVLTSQGPEYTIVGEFNAEA